MTDPCQIPHDKINPLAKLAEALQDARADIPLRAKSVCLSERPRSKYARPVRSADNRIRYSGKQFFQHQSSEAPQPKSRQRTKKVVVKQQKRNVIEKVPFAVSVQNLSIPMRYADSTSKLQCDEHVPIKYSNSCKQVGDNKRLCSTVRSGKETENKLLLQISEADQVSDFERILNSNAILSERSRHVWRGVAHSAASVGSRPRSSYSLHTVSEAYHYLFKQHEDSLQPLIHSYRKAAADDHSQCPTSSLLQDNWQDNLHGLSEFYEEDQALQQEIETITDRIITEEINSTAEGTKPSSGKSRNFNVNLTGLLGLRVNGEGYSPVSNQDGPSPDIDKAADEVYEDKEWLDPSMNAKSDDRNPNETESIEGLAQNLNSVSIDSDGKVPTITFSNCCDAHDKSEQSDNTDVAIHLAVPSADSIDEARPPMM